MSFLYLTADVVGLESGGGLVTANESQALKSLGPTEVWGRGELTCDGPDPWGWDECVVRQDEVVADEPFRLCHIYSGTFSKSVEKMKSRGTKICYTCAAHDVKESRAEHENVFKIPYAKLYPHLVEPDLWTSYSAGYFNADVLVCPSTHSEKVLREQGAKNRIVVIPHGCEKVKEVPPLPRRWCLGNMGAIGPDKGVIYLLQAWKKLNYKDAVLVFAGRESISPGMSSMLERFGGGNIQLMGWVSNLSDFYKNVSCYCQSSVSEGFGIEVVEALSYGRPVLCSTGAGAADVVAESFRFPPRDVDALAEKIDAARKLPEDIKGYSALADVYEWGKIRRRYIDLWKGLL